MDEAPQQHDNPGALIQTDQALASSAEPSRGERLLPYLFAGMEACCVAVLLIGLADIHFLGAGAPLLPLWAVFVVVAGACWCDRFWQQSRRGFSSISQSDKVSGVCFLLAAVVFAALAVPWLIRLDAGYAAVAFLLFVFLCYRGFRIAEREIDPAYASRALGTGLISFLIAICLQLIGPSVGAAPYLYGDLFLLLFVLAFLFLLLLARALSNLIFIRQGHRVEQEDEGRSVRSQERAVMQMVVVFGLLFLLVALASASFASPGFLAHMQQFVAAGYAWGTHALATVISIVLSPILWLLNAIHFKLPALAPISQTVQPCRRGTPHLPGRPPSRASSGCPSPPPGVLPSRASSAARAAFTLPLVIEIILLIALLLLLTALFVWLVQRVLRRRVHQPVEQRESIWSWSLFWSRVKVFWLALFARLRIRRKNSREQEEAGTIALENAPTTLSVRDVRAIYHALLKKAALLGYPRQLGETPFEFEERLEQQVPAVKAELTAITEMYVAVRYGGYVPDQTETPRVRNLWSQLERDWQA